MQYLIPVVLLDSDIHGQHVSCLIQLFSVSVSFKMFSNLVMCNVALTISLCHKSQLKNFPQSIIIDLGAPCSNKISSSMNLVTSCALAIFSVFNAKFGEIISTNNNPLFSSSRSWKSSE